MSNTSEMDQELAEAKARVLALNAAVETADPGAVGVVLADHVAADLHWRGMHPFHEISGPADLAHRFWAPFKTAFPALRRRMDVFFAGRNEIDGFASVWVASMGHFQALFDGPWLGIRPSRKLVLLRYAEFHKVVAGRVVETALFLDIPQLMIQAGLQPFPVQTAADLIAPGPLTHDGVMRMPAPPGEGVATLALINRMISDLGQWQSGLPLEEELARTWAPDMLWWGPTGIGSAYTIPRYAEQHSAPFRAGLTDRSRTGHLCRMAEGAYGGFFGWPNFTARPTGGFMGMPGADRAGEFRVVDIYRREGDRLAENWVFIDLLHFWNTLGVDVLARCTGIDGV